jgi:hypothetical protein
MNSINWEIVLATVVALVLERVGEHGMALKDS